jgi:uncharacterized protein YyaL (SSP411 family)
VLRLIRTKFRPHAVVACQRPDASAPTPALALVQGKTAQGDVTTYVCQNFTCQAPLIGVAAARSGLD